MSIRDLAEAYLVLRDGASPDDQLLLRDRLMSAFLGECSEYEVKSLLGPKAATWPQDTDPGIPGLEQEDFEDAIKHAGYVDVDMGMIKWGLADVASLSREERAKKMAMIKALDAPKEKKIVQIVQEVNHDQDVSRCPRCQTSGIEKKVKATGKTFYVCGDPECRRPSGRQTTWDEGNWTKVAAE